MGPKVGRRCNKFPMFNFRRKWFCCIICSTRIGMNKLLSVVRRIRPDIISCEGDERYRIRQVIYQCFRTRDGILLPSRKVKRDWMTMNFNDGLTGRFHKGTESVNATITKKTMRIRRIQGRGG